MTMTDHTTIATHNGSFHADDVFGVGVLMGVFPSHTLVRTRDQALIDAADYVVDVGGIWDLPAKGGKPKPSEPPAPDKPCVVCADCNAAAFAVCQPE